MNKKLRVAILSQIKALVKTPGYFFALCMILIEDNTVIAEELNEIDNRQRLNVKEQSLLLGFLLQNGIDFTRPDNPLHLIELKDKTYELMENLHSVIFQPNVNKMKEFLDKDPSKIERVNPSDYYKGDDLFVEQIFYSDNGAYDFQYLDFLSDRYVNDAEWLLKNRNFSCKEALEIIKIIQETISIKAQKINFLSLKEKIPELKKEAKKVFPKKDFDNQFKKQTSFLEFFQYSKLFSKDIINNETFIDLDIFENGWDGFYTGIVDLFVVEKNIFDESLNIELFLENFAVNCQGNISNSFANIGEFNEYDSRPIIILDEERFFVPILFQLCEALFESPFYWTLDDKEYLKQVGGNRGKAGEIITYNLLEKVFGEENIFHSIDIESKKGRKDSEIDVFCVFGNKALCVQVKSKKLTLSSRAGSSEDLSKDFKGAVQDAYNQGVICRNKVLENKAKFYTSGRKEWKLPSGIEDVYILGITTENYPSLNHQSNIFLEKDLEDPNAIFMSIFDLEVVTHYLSKPYEFLYYVKQRTELVDYFNAENEIVYLAYHLQVKLDRDEKYGLIQLDNGYAQNIDRNYYPMRRGLNVTTKNDKLSQRWQNQEFVNLCSEIATYNFPQKTDVIFGLYDWDAETRDSIVKQLKNCKLETISDNSNHDRTLLSKERFGSKSGITCFTQSNIDLEDLSTRLSMYCRAKKYRCKADMWIGFGTISVSPNMTDTILLLKDTWEYNKEEEEFANKLLPQQPTRAWKLDGGKIGRNEKCICGSGKKYKKCCGKFA